MVLLKIQFKFHVWLLFILEINFLSAVFIHTGDKSRTAIGCCCIGRSSVGMGKLGEKIAW